jgi:hypothetical protein
LEKCFLLSSPLKGSTITWWGRCSFVLAHWVYLSTDASALPDWGESSALALKLLLPEVLMYLLLINVEQSPSLLQSVGLDLQLVELKT